MKGRNYIQNKKPLSDAEMDKFKDFDGLVEKLDGGPDGQADNGSSMNAFSGIGKGFLLFLGAAVIVWFAVIKLKPNKEIAEKEAIVLADTNTAVNKYEVIPPFDGIDVDYEKFTIDAQKDVELLSKNKSKITIEKNSFKDKKGNLVKGEMTIEFREFHNPLDIFKAGIPMEYDSAGSTYTFESAGMFEIRALQNGERLQNDLEKDIVVDIVSKNDGDQFNKYAFNEEKGAWDYKSKCAIVKEEKEMKPLVNEKDTEQEFFIKNRNKAAAAKSKPLVKVEVPVVPKFPELVSDKYAFTIDYDKKKFPELENGVVFQVDENRSKFSSIYYDLNWDKVAIKRSKVKGNYSITLQKGEKILNIESFPALPKAEYLKRREKYTKDLAIYNAYIAQFAVTQTFAPQVSNTERNVIGMLNKFAVPAGFSGRRSFRVNRMGYWNSDHPINTSAVNGRNVLAFFTNGEEDITVKRTYNVVGKRNVLFSAKTNSTVTFNPKAKNTMWAITEDGKIAITNSDEFAAINTAEYTFNVDVYSASKGLRILKARM